MRKKITLNRLHRWAGLSAGLWLAVLGISGFILDHRDNWNWLWQNGISSTWLPERIIEKSRAGSLRLYQIVDEERTLVGGPAGLWWNEKKDWQKTQFSQPSPWVRNLVNVGADWWIASNNGVWVSRDQGRSAKNIALAGYNITALVHDDANTLWGVVDRSRVFQLDLSTTEITWLKLKPLDEEELPASIDLSRLVHDLHFGRGVFSAPYSLLWSDVTAIALILLPIGGVLYWWLPKIWRRRRLQGNEINKQKKQNIARWLYRSHAPVIGIVTAIPIIYLSLTGVVLDHAPDLRGLLKKTNLSQSILPPVYRLPKWKNEIYAILVNGENEKQFSLGTRLGLFSTSDNGNNWQLQRLNNHNKANFVWMARQFGKQQIIGGMGGPNRQRMNKQAWKTLPHGVHMPTDVTLNSHGTMVWKNSKGLYELRPNNQYQKISVPLPKLGYVPWFYVIDGLHSGMLIHPQWKWVNDIIAILAIILVITGFMRWWRVKWL